MGLDMYLTKKVHVGAEYEHRKITGKIEIFQNGTPIEVNFSRVSEIEERAGYWRKANAIHKWFVENVQGGADDCGDYYVPREDLQELLDTVRVVKADHSKAPELLPAQSGFFFGSTEYDEWYFRDLDTTETILSECLANEDGEYHYHSSW